jgi:hypothetical protein
VQDERHRTIDRVAALNAYNNMRAEAGT